MGLELTTYNITFKWISVNQIKTADYLPRLVDLPHDRHATVQMLSTTNHDGPIFHTISRIAQSSTPENLTPHHKKDTAPPDITECTDTPDAMPKLLTKDRLQALLQMERTDPLCKCISRHLSNRKAPNHEADLFLHMKGLLYIHVTDSNQKFLALVIPKA